MRARSQVFALRRESRMERRPYFVIGDIAAALFAGAAGGWMGHALPGSWPMLPAMFSGMILGMLAGNLVGLLFAPFFGAMEVMVPAALSGMAAGMILTMVEVGSGEVALFGASIGLGCLIATYSLQAWLHGEVRRWT